MAQLLNEQQRNGMLPASPDTVAQVAFSSDGSLLATANDDGTVYLAKMRLFADMFAALCSDVGAPTSNEWKEYASGEPMTDACAS
ncbi:hypothetical protein ACIOJG_30020 [Streptomyces anulatus]